MNAVSLTAGEPSAGIAAAMNSLSWLMVVAISVPRISSLLAK